MLNLLCLSCVFISMGCQLDFSHSHLESVHRLSYVSTYVVALAESKEGEVKPLVQAAAMHGHVLLLSVEAEHYACIILTSLIFTLLLESYITTKKTSL